MEKKLIEKDIISIESNNRIILTEDMIAKIKPGDIILSGYDEGHYSENNSWEGHFYFNLIRKRLETDEEFEQSKKDWKNLAENLKERRYKNYLKLKKEFENE